MADATPRSLGNIGLLATLPEPARRELERRCNWRDYRADEQVISKDSESSDVYFVVTGAVRVVNYSYTGREVSYDDIDAGGFFGELSAIDGKPRSATVIALKKSLIATVTPETFQRTIRENPELSFAIVKRLAVIIRGANERIMDLSTLGAYSRVYAEILRLARQAAKPNTNEAMITPVPVHSDLASRCGTTRETVARALSDLSKKGIAEKQGAGLFIAEIGTLKDIVEGDDGK
jgi:CRP/FNR family transcriptional regulator, cyclic AMP receptor protein